MNFVETRQNGAEQISAQPVLASTLYDSFLDRKRTGAPSTKRTKTIPRTGIKPIDELVLDGSFTTESQIGAIVGIAIGRELETSGQLWGRQLLHQTVSTHLLSHHSAPNQDHERTRVYVVETTNTFSPRFLHSLLASRLRSNSINSTTHGFGHEGGYVYTASRTVSSSPKEGEGELQDEATKLLDRVALLRVFDFEGLMEAVGEIIDAVTTGNVPATATSANAGRNAPTSPHNDSDETIMARDCGKEVLADPQEAPGHGDAQCRKERAHIADSDDEMTEAEITMNSSLPCSHPTSEDVGEDTGHNGQRLPEDITPQLPSLSEAADNEQHGEHHEVEEEYAPLIYIPGFHTVLSTLLKKNHVRGHALLVHLLRRLRHLALFHGATIILGNATVSPIQGAKADGEGVSAFEDITSRPALGRTLAWGLDLSLMLARLPTSELAVIMECLQDGTGPRAGNWVALEMRKSKENEGLEIKRVTE